MLSQLPSRYPYTRRCLAKSSAVIVILRLSGDSLANICQRGREQPNDQERLLFYFWFRATAINHNLKEECFQKLERNWDLVMAQVNACMDSLACSRGGVLGSGSASPNSDFALHECWGYPDDF